MQENQLMNTLSTPSSPSPTASSEVTEDPHYCVIFTSLGKDCPGKIGLSSDQDKEDHQTKEKDQPEASSNIFIMPTQTLKPSKPYITKYFDSMSNDTPS